MGHRCTLATFVVLVGCYAPPSETCLVQCGTNNECPGALICGPDRYCGDGVRCSDVDTDGVADRGDNCPDRANKDQHDEDVDDLGDVCDPCPHLRGDAADGDGDDVGDACDPQPTIAKQRIRFFDPFTTEDPAWDPTNGWSWLTDTMRGQGTGASEAYNGLFVPDGEARIATAGTITSIGAPPHQLSLSFGSTGSTFFYGEFYDEEATAGHVGIMYADHGVYTPLVRSGFPGAVPTGTWSLVIDESVSAQHITIASTLGGATRETLNVDAQLIVGTKQFLVVKNADIQFDYYLVIETMP